MNDSQLSLLALVRQIAVIIRPVRPRPAFRAELHQCLVASARQCQTQQLLALSPHTSMLFANLRSARLRQLQASAWLSESANRRLVLGAAAVGSAAVSVAGLLAYVLRQRGRKAA